LIGFCDTVANRNIQVHADEIIRRRVIECIRYGSAEVTGYVRTVVSLEQRIQLATQAGTTVKADQRHAGKQSIASSLSADLTVDQIDVGFKELGAILQGLLNHVS